MSEIHQIPHNANDSAPQHDFKLSEKDGETVFGAGTIVPVDSRLDQFTTEPHLSKKLGFFSMLCVVTTIMASWQTCMGSLIASLLSGGPAAMLYGYVFVWLCTLCAAASLSEMLSIWPTAAGPVHWAYELAPEKWARSISFFVGWINIIGQIMLTCGAAYVVGANVIGQYTLTHPDFQAQRYQICLGFWGIILVAALLNIFFSRRLALINYLAVTWSIVGWLVTIIVMARMGERNTARFVFATFINETGWPDGVAWILGLLQSAYALAGYDVVSHLSEEIDNPEREAPKAMFLSIVGSGIFAIPYLIVVLFFISDIESIATSPTGYPFLQLMYDIVKNKGGAIALSFLVTGAAMIATVSLTASISRTIWAFARDGGLPLARYLGTVNTKLDAPVWAIIATAAIMCIPGFINLGNSTAFQAVLSVAVVGLNLSYLAVIALMIFGGRKRCDAEELWGPWNLGKYGLAINIVGGLYCFIISIFLLFPVGLPVAAVNMNYAIVIVAAIAFGSTASWYGGGRKSYKLSTPSYT